MHRKKRDSRTFCFLTHVNSLSNVIVNTDFDRNLITLSIFIKSRYLKMDDYLKI